MTQTTEFKQVDNDSSNNNRFVCHFFAFLTDKEINSYGIDNYNELYNLALSRSRVLGGRKFHNRQYGGGIAFATTKERLEQLSNRIEQIRLNAIN